MPKCATQTVRRAPYRSKGYLSLIQHNPIIKLNYKLEQCKAAINKLAHWDEIDPRDKKPKGPRDWHRICGVHFISGMLHFLKPW